MDTVTAQWQYLIKQWQDTPEAQGVGYEELERNYLQAVARGVPPSAAAWRDIVAKTKAAQGGNSGGDDGIPYIDEPLLRTIISMEAVRQMTGTQLKMVASLYPYDSNGNTIVPIGKKFEARLAWLKEHSDISPEAVAEAINRALGGNKLQQPQTIAVRKRTEDPRITAIREQIERESKGYTDYAHRKGARLNKMLDELLREPERQVYRDRSRGGIEVIKGLGAVERIMAEKIRDYDSPFK